MVDLSSDRLITRFLSVLSVLISGQILAFSDPRCRAIPAISYPTRPFPILLANKALTQFDPWAALAPRLRDPWVTLG